MESGGIQLFRARDAAENGRLCKTADIRVTSDPDDFHAGRIRSIHKRPASRAPGFSDRRGLTLIELMVVIAIIAILAAIAVPSMFQYRYNAQVARTITEMKTIEQALFMYKMSNGRFPESLGAVGWGDAADVWGNPYQYTRVRGTNIGQLRKNRNMVPVNTDFDLYSMGRSGKSRKPFTAAHSKDDVVRADDGGYFGLVSNY